jgi:hypothetical protein
MMGPSSKIVGSPLGWDLRPKKLRNGGMVEEVKSGDFGDFPCERPHHQPNGDPTILDEGHLTPNQRPVPIPIRRSQDEPTEYKLSGMLEDRHHCR